MAEPLDKSSGSIVLPTALMGIVPAPSIESRMTGKFKFAQGGASVGLTISAAAGAAKNYEASIDMGSPNCGGQIWGPVKAVSSTEMVLSQVASSGNDECKVHLLFDGKYNSVSISEDGSGCSSFHGAQCEFGGTLRRHSR